MDDLYAVRCTRPSLVAALSLGLWLLPNPGQAPPPCPHGPVRGVKVLGHSASAGLAAEPSTSFLGRPGQQRSWGRTQPWPVSPKPHPSLRPGRLDSAHLGAAAVGRSSLLRPQAFQAKGNDRNRDPVWGQRPRREAAKPGQCLGARRAARASRRVRRGWCAGEERGPAPPRHAGLSVFSTSL